MVMGVKGLLSFITDQDDVLQTVELSQLVTKIGYETEKTPKLLCDLMNLVSHFLNPPVTKLTSCGDYPWYAQVTGADFHLIADRACNFVAALKHLGVEPVFFVDGARGTDESFEGKAHVLKYRETQKLQRYFRLQQVCERTVDKNIGVYLPCNAIQQIKKSIKKAGAEIVYCTGEADPEIIHYAQSHDEVCGILSNDSDFAITNGCVMFPIETFDINNSLGILKDVLVDDKPGEIVCQVIYPSILANSLGIRENQLPDLAVLCGTDYTHHLNRQLSVLSKLGVKGGGVENIAEWLKDKEMPLLHCQPMRELCTDHPELRVAIEQSYNNYTLEVPKNIDSPSTAVSFASPLFHIIEKEASSGENNVLLTVAKKGILWRTMIIENLTLGQPCLSSLLLPLRRVMYGLLGVQEVREYGRSQMEAYDEVVVPVCTKPGDVELGIHCFHSLRELEHSGKLVGMFRLMNQSLDAQNISDVKKVVDRVICSSHELPDLPGCRLVQSAMLCCCLKFIACLNKVSQPPLGLTDSELDAILVTCLTCATDGQVMPHIVNVMPSMRTFTVSEWFALILMHCYRVASLVGVVSCPEPKQMFYQMAFVPHHLSLESHVNITTEQKLEIDYVRNAMKTALTFPSVETLRTSIFNSDELQPLSLLVTLFSAALDEVMENADKLLPCVMAMDDKDLVKEKSCSEPKDTPETDSESSASQSESEVNNRSPSNEPTHSNQPLSDSKYRDAQFQSLKEAVDRAVASHSLQSSISPAKAKLKSLSRMSLSARQSALQDYIWKKEGLPVTEHKEEILKLISNHQVVCIEGETGCGKSSQVPQFILEASEQCKILASQPNLLAARKLAQRVSEERGEPLGKTVGYCDELGDIPPQTVLTFGTTGYILKALLKSQTECSYTHIILDEIHERSTEIDYALFITRKLAVTFPDLKIILVSATLQGNLFIEYFRKELGHDKVADPYFVGIKRFPVKVVFIDQLDELVSSREDKEQQAAMNQLQVLARKLENNAAQLLPYAPEVTPFTEGVCMNLIISQLSPGDAVLIFLSGFGDINEFCNNLHRKLKKLGMRHRYRLFIFHSQVQNEDQDKAFQEPSEGTANIIVTNRGSESSLTIPYLRLVINFGINKEMMYNSAKRISELSRQWCSRASCIQREGRVGRVSEGTAVHLFTKEFYETLPDFGPPEIIRVPLAKTFLRAKEIGPQLGIPLPSHLLSKVIEPPSFVQFSTALHDLAEYGAIAHSPQHKISEEADVTLLGKFSLSLPLDLNLCRLVFLGILFGCPLDGIIIAAASAMYQDVFLKPMKVIMNELHQFCHSLTISTFSRMKYDAGCYSNPIMMLNMFIDWLQYKNRQSHTSRRELAVKFGSNNAVKPARLLHFEEFVGDIARCVANCIPCDTALYSELQTLSHISTEMKGFPVFCDTFMYGEPPSPLQPAKYIPPHLRNLKSQKRDRVSLHFCNNYVMLKALIAAAAPDDILCGERACDSSHPYSRTFAQECIKVIKNEGFSLNHTLCMDLSDLEEVDIWAEDIQKTDEAAFEKLFRNLPRGFRLSVEIKVVEEIAVLHFQPHTHDPFFALTKIAKSFAIKNWDSSTADISQISPKADFFWRFGEQNILWDIDQVDAVFPAPSHPCALMWYRFDESKSQVDTVLLNFRNPTGFVCQYDKPSQPYFGVATGAFVSSGGIILAPRLTLLPNMPTSLMMVLAFQLPTSAVEFLINKKNKTVKAIKINSVEIPCTDIQNYMSSNEILAINQVRNAVSNVMTLSLKSGCIPLCDTAITKIPKLLHDLLSFHKIPQPMAANSQAPSMNEAQEGLVWELVTPGKNTEEQSASGFFYYPEFECSLVGAKPYAVKEACHDQELPLSPFPIEYTQSVSATLLAESKRILEQGRENEVDDLCSVPESLKEMSVISSDEENTENRFAENTDWTRVASVNVSAAGISEDKEWTGDTTEANMECKTSLNSKKMKQKHEQLEVTPVAKSAKKTVHNKLGSEPDSRQVIAEQYLVKLEQEVTRHLQRNNKMEFLSELKVQRRIKHLCSSVGINLDVNFFHKWPELFKVREVEEGKEGSDAAVTGKEYLIILDPSKWENVVEDEGPVLPTSAQLLQVAIKSHLAAKEKDTAQRQNAEDISVKEKKVQSDKEADLMDSEKVKKREAVLSEKKRVQREQEVSLKVIETEKLKQEEDVEEWVEREQEPSPAGKENEKLNQEMERVEKVQESSLKLKQEAQECEETLSEEKLERGKEANVLEKEKIPREKEDVVSKGSIEKEIKAFPREVQEREAALIEERVKREGTVLKEKENEKLKQEEDAEFNEERVEKVQDVSLKLKQKVQQCEKTLSEEKPERGKEANVLEKIKSGTEVLSKGSVEREKNASPREVQEREAALIEKSVKREKEAALKESENRDAALCEDVRVEREKDVALKEKDSMQKEAKVALHEKGRVETDKEVPLKKHENVEREEEADLREKDKRKEKKKKRKRKKKKENEREKKEAALAATNSEQEPPTQSATAGLVPQGSQPFSLSQLLFDNAGAGNPEDNSTESKTETVNRCQAGVELLDVSHTNETLKETTVSGSQSAKQKVTSEVAPKKIPAQPGTGEHMAQFLVDFINECGGQTRLTTLRREAFRQYQAKYVQCTYRYLGKWFLKKYDFFEIFEDSSGVCHVRVVSAKRRPSLSTELEKTEHKTKKMTKSLSAKSSHGTEEHKRTHGSCDTWLLDGDFDGSPEHIVQYLYNYLFTHFFPYGCPVSSLDELYQKEYVPKCINPQVEIIDENFLKEFPNHFTLQGRQMFVKLKEGVDHSNTSQLSGSPYTPQHVKHYFSKYLGQEGVVCTQQLQKVFDECYMKEFKMPQKPLIWFVRDDFFRQSRHLFVTFTDFVVFRK